MKIKDEVGAIGNEEAICTVQAYKAPRSFQRDALSMKLVAPHTPLRCNVSNSAKKEGK